MKLVEIMQVYEGSNGDVTKALYERLQKDHGTAGFVAMNLFRACKNSERAKKYRGGNGKGSYRQQAYERKSWSLDLLAKALAAHAAPLGIAWGWARDDRAIGFENVVYIDLPTGQVSFHNQVRGVGPDFTGKWDGVQGKAPERICRWINKIMHTAPKRAEPEDQHDADVQAGYPFTATNPAGERD